MGRRLVNKIRFVDHVNKFRIFVKMVCFEVRELWELFPSEQSFKKYWYRSEVSGEHLEKCQFLEILPFRRLEAVNPGVWFWFSNSVYDKCRFTRKSQGWSFHTPKYSILKLHKKILKEEVIGREGKKIPKLKEMLKITVSGFCENPAFLKHWHY